MSERRLKIVFFILAFGLLAALLLISRDAGISGDEEVHHEHAEKVYHYYASMGKVQDALSTPKTHLQYYGQTPDNLAVILIHWFGIQDVFGFRHLFSSFLGWLAIFVTALFARWLKGYGAAILTLALFAVSPRFLGHLQNNLKDIPFALAYIAGVFYILKLTYTKFKSQPTITISLLIASIAFSVGIRAGGILLAFYLLFAGFLYFFADYIQTRKLDWLHAFRTVIFLLIISSAGYLIGILLWPYALQNPLVNPWQSYQKMTHFPTTIQQIFDGNFIWSDYHPWYYLPRYMAITIPVIVFAGVILFLVFSGRIIEKKHRLSYGFIVFSILFPPVFVILKNANLYGAWRHFIFVYPAVVLLSAIGFHGLFQRYKNAVLRGIMAVAFIFLAIHPLKFMVNAHPYYYLYYNQFTGGLNGAYGKYETDYYYHTMRSGAEWLQAHLKEKDQRGKVVVGSNFPVKWYFRNEPNVGFQHFSYHQRNDFNWDYAIIGNSYIHPEQLRNGNFPPEGTIHQVMVEGVPVCVVVERKSKFPAKAAKAFENEDYEEAVGYYRKALESYQKDEHLYYKLGKSLNLQGNNRESLDAVNQSLAINANYEPSLKLSAQLKMAAGDYLAAKTDLAKLIGTNKKYFSAYVDLAKIYQQEGKLAEARETLKKCLRVNSRYKPAILALADTYRESHPEIAGKYDELANSINRFN
ncbi:tetratricopeptide repeat protein [Gaoshiqia sp. Z1-71]|uniref:tetratricopeptide repeat protein n=1 Tax=Gaoshiqia hydrogeniformans TaxID=3290090 RepID=UPI003BF7EAF3